MAWLGRPAHYMNTAINAAADKRIGLGEGLGRFIKSGTRLRNSNFSTGQAAFSAEAYGRKIPVTVHVAIGTDIIHAHPAGLRQSTG